MRRVPSVAVFAVLARGVPGPPTCWVDGYSREFCCDVQYGPAGNAACWDDLFQYDPCCTRPEPLGPTLSVPGSGSSARELHLLDSLEQAFGPMVELQLAEGSAIDMEAGLRQSIASPENRTVSERTSHAYLAVLLRSLGRETEALREVAEIASTELSISTSGAWIGATAAGYHMHDLPFAAALVDFFRERRAETVVDFGCGLGLYVRDLRAAGFRAGGFDGNPATAAISEGRCQQAELSQELDLGVRWDWVLSLEVAEHIPRAFEADFLANLDRHACAGLVLSWGNQAGEGHVNLRTRTEVEGLLTARGFRVLEKSTAALGHAAGTPWLRETVLVFERDPPLLGDECTRLA